jgi:hypothetical protein
MAIPRLARRRAALTMKSHSDAMSDAERAILDLLARVEALEARLAAIDGQGYKERAGEREHARPGPDTGNPRRLAAND